MNAVQRQSRWLMFMSHASRCDGAPHCGYGVHCIVGRALALHTVTCADGACALPRCLATRQLVAHHSACADQACPVCGPVRHAHQQAARASADSEGPEESEAYLCPSREPTAHGDSRR